VWLVVDEIQTGMARCGAMWACELFDVHPEVLVAGKAIGGGVPIGAIAVRADLVRDAIESEPWNILTFMNQPLAAAAGMAVLDIVEEEGLADRARKLGTGDGAVHGACRPIRGDRRRPRPGPVHRRRLRAGQSDEGPGLRRLLRRVEYAVDQGLLCQFGGIGGNVLKFKPPLTTRRRTSSGCSTWWRT